MLAIEKISKRFRAGNYGVRDLSLEVKSGVIGLLGPNGAGKTTLMQMIDRSQQGRALGLMQSAGSAGRLVGPLLGGWLLMFDLGQPLTHYARTPFFAGAAILLIAFGLALTFRKRASDKVQAPVTVEADV